MVNESIIRGMVNAGHEETPVNINIDEIQSLSQEFQSRGAG